MMKQKTNRMISLNGWIEIDLDLDAFAQLPELINFTADNHNDEIEFFHHDIGRLVISGKNPTLIHGEIEAEDHEHFFHQFIDSLAQSYEISFHVDFFEEDGRLIRRKYG